MREKIKGIVILVFLVTVFSYVQAMGEKPILKNGIGSVTNVSENVLTINEYDLDSGEYIDREYAIDPKAELKNISAVKNIAVNDNVEYKYILKEGKKTITFITIDKLPAEEKVIDGKGFPEEYTEDELNSNESMESSPTAQIKTK